MALTQMQIIQSLGEAMNWFQKEIEWGVDPAELRHLCGRIGELFVALTTNGRMAQTVNEKGYDVVSSNGERISVKTTTMNYKSGHIEFNSKTLECVDRIIVLFINTEEMQIEVLLDKPVMEVKRLFQEGRNCRFSLSLSKIQKLKTPVRKNLEIVSSANYKDYRIVELETGTINLFFKDKKVDPVRPTLWKIAKELKISIFNSNGNHLNTRQLGALLIILINEKR